MLWRVILLEIDKTFKRPLFWIEISIFSVIIALIDVAEYLLSLVLPATQARAIAHLFTWPLGLMSSLQFAEAHGLGGILLVILVGAITAREYSWRTFHLWLSRGVPRIVLMEAKCIIALLAATIITLTSLIVGAILTGIFTLVVYGSLNLNQVDFGRLILSFLITDYGLLPYVALTFMLTLLSRSAILSIGGVLAFILLIESTLYTTLTLFGGTGGKIVQYLPTGLEDALYTATMPSQSSLLHISSPPPIVAILVLALYILLFAGFGIWRFLHQNFTD